MELGIGTYSFMWSLGNRAMDGFDLLAKAVELGVKRVQFGPNYPISEGNVDAISSAAKKRGLTIEIGMAGLDLQEIREQLELCREVGSPLLRTVLQETPEGAPDESWIQERLALAIPYLQKSRIHLAVENSVTPAAALASVCQDEWVGVVLDTVNSLAIGEGWRHVTEHLAKSTLCFHVKDFKVVREWHKMGFRVEGRPAGQGQLDIPWILSMLGDRCQSAILELWVPEQGTREETIALEQKWAAESIETLRGWIPN